MNTTYFSGPTIYHSWRGVPVWEVSIPFYRDPLPPSETSSLLSETPLPRWKVSIPFYRDPLPASETPSLLSETPLPPVGGLHTLLQRPPSSFRNPFPSFTATPSPQTAMCKNITFLQLRWWVVIRQGHRSYHDGSICWRWRQKVTHAGGIPA